MGKSYEVTYKNVTYTSHKALCKKFNINYSTFKSRFNDWGLSLEESIEKPIKETGRHKKICNQTWNSDIQSEDLNNPVKDIQEVIQKLKSFEKEPNHLFFWESQNKIYQTYSTIRGRRFRNTQIQNLTEHDLNEIKKIIVIKKSN